MLFENLSDRLQGIFKKLRGHGKLTEDDVNEAMREVRMALLEADVNFKVVKDFVKRVKERAVGQEVLDTLTAAQAVVKIVDEELTALMGGTESRLNISPNPPTVIMLVGLQGSGKTTSAGKLALMLKKQGKRPLLVADDIYRPAGRRTPSPLRVRQSHTPPPMPTTSLSLIRRGVCRLMRRSCRSCATSRRK